VKRQKKLSIGLIWSQFAAYHVDRCEAVARRFEGRAEVAAIEVATTSTDYAWEPSGGVAGARKITLFPGRSFDSIAALRRFVALLRATRHCDVVCIGLSYGLADAILLSWTLRLMGKRVIVFSESKFDDCQRSVWFEAAKAVVLRCYTGAIVGGRRHIDYFRFLRFGDRPLYPGYDSVGLARIREQGGGVLAPQGPDFETRPFIFVGRFVGKKNLPTLLEAYARYRSLAGAGARRLVLIGSGDEEPLLRRMGGDLGLADWVDFPGFLSASAVSRALSEAIALVLPSREEQWGLVVNEALAFGLPVIVTNEVGSRDLLVRNLLNGFVCESNCADSLARAMLACASDRERWTELVSHSHERAWMGDADRLADALELVLDPACAEPASRVAALMNELELPPLMKVART